MFSFLQSKGADKQGVFKRLKEERGSFSFWGHRNHEVRYYDDPVPGDNFPHQLFDR